MALGRELPDDLAADVLRRLPPRSLAVCQCACRAWRDLIDDQRLLRKHLLPRTVGGIFINYFTYYSSEFLARPTAGPSIAGDLGFIPAGFSQVMDHCNGLLLCTYHDHDHVANPATRQWARLPPPPPPRMRNRSFCNAQCLVYDPAVSPHYHVFCLIGSSSLHQEDQHKSELQGYVYSSETGRWEERWFAPEVPTVVETVAIAVALEDNMLHNKVYWRGRLYLLCKNDLVLRISISNADYKLFSSPAADVDLYRSSLGRSEKGIYCALFEYDWPHLQIFLLNESCGQVVWELKHSVDLTTFARKLHARENCNYSDRADGPWILEDINYYKYPYGNHKRRREVVEHNLKFEWNSDDDNVLSTEDMVEGCYKGYTSLLGFHPYKEVVFLNAGLSRAVAYHWNASKFQDMGNICPKDYRDFAGLLAAIETSFIYTPCWIWLDNFPKHSMETGGAN